MTQPLVAPVEPAEEQGHDRPSPPAISAIWLPAASAETKSLTARIQNTTPEAKVVTLALVGSDPYGRERERSLGRKTVPARSSLDVSIPVRDVPAQSSGHASTVAVSVEYPIEARNPDGTTRQFNHKVHSLPTYLTFSDDFSRAAARTVDEQARASTKVAARGVAKLRQYNAAYDRIEEVDAQLVGNDAPALLGVTDVAPGPLPGAVPAAGGAQ